MARTRLKACVLFASLRPFPAPGAHAGWHLVRVVRGQPLQRVSHGPQHQHHHMAHVQVGISSVWYEGNPCNMHLMDLAAEVKKGVEDTGLVGYRFNTIGVSDGISMGTDGMCFSLQSRDIIADSIETVMSAQW
eukprot:314542-Chlamydomonas_euryale.AAC.1